MKMIKLPKFQERLRSEIRKKKLTLMQIEDATGHSPALIYGWLNGRNLPLASSIYDLAKLLNVSADWLLGISDVKEIR